MDKKLQTQVLALAMQIIGLKDPNLFKLAMTMMSEQGRTKFLSKCAEIILSGDMSEENIALAQQEALKAILEGQLGLLAILAKLGNRITYLNRFYSGGAVKTFDGGYMKLKRPLTKDLVEGRLSIGLYKGLWMYLNGDKVAVPNLNGKQKGEDGSTHVNRAYYGMLIKKPKYSFGGMLSSAGNWFNKNQNLAQGIFNIGLGGVEAIKQMNKNNWKDNVDFSQANLLMHQGGEQLANGISNLSKNGNPNSNLTLNSNSNIGDLSLSLPDNMVKDPYSGKIYPKDSPEEIQIMKKIIDNLPENPFEQYSTLKLPNNNLNNSLKFNFQSLFLN